MQHSRWLIGLFFSLLCTLALGQAPQKITPVQVPGKIPPVKVSPVKLPAKEIPGAAAALEASQPFIEQYVFCNAMQLYQSRTAAWEPVYRDAGASDAELKTHSANLVNYIKTFCSNGPQEYWQSALDKIEAFDDLTDRRTAEALGISLSNATSFRLSRLLENIEQFQRECLGGEESGALADLLTMAGSLLPATLAPPGISLPRKDLSTTFGKCGPTPNFGSSRAYTSLDQESLSQCMSNALAQSATCDSPVASNHGPAVRQETLGGSESGDAESGRSTDKWRLVYRDGAYTEVTRRRVSTNDMGESHSTELRTEETYSAGGELERREHLMSRDGRPVAYDEGLATDMFESPPDPSVGASSSPRERQIINAGERLRVGVPAGFMFIDNPAVKHESGWWEHTTSIVPRSRDCLSVNPGSAAPLGLSRTAGSATEGGSPIHAGRLNTFDMIGQCLCTSLGRLGADLAARSGMSCGPDENTRRLDCLMNPRGPADGIRPECVGYLQADNPGRDTRTAFTEWCGRVAQCPPGAALASTSATGGVMCSCGGGLATPAGYGSGTPGSSRCAAVSCAGGPGTAGSDLYGECCGAPGDLPIGVSPSSGPPGLPPMPQPEELPEMTKKLPPEKSLPKEPLPEK